MTGAADGAVGEQAGACLSFREIFS